MFGVCYSRRRILFSKRRTTTTLRPAPFLPPVEYVNASPFVKEIYDDIIAKRKLEGPHNLNNFWKVIANDEALLKRTWVDLNQVMKDNGVLDPLTKELIYVAVSQVNSCEYCMLSHGAAAKKKGMTKEMYQELVSIVGMATETNRLATSLRVPPDDHLFENVPFSSPPNSPKSAM